MPAKKYASEEALLSAMFGTVNKTAVSVEPSLEVSTKVEPRKKETRSQPPQPRQQEMWVEDRVRRAATAEQISTHAEIIAKLFEDSELSPNLVVWQQDDDLLAPTDWRKAAKRAGKLLNRNVTVFKSRGRMTAVLIQTADEQAAESQRLSEVMHASISGDEMPPPLPRNFRDGG